MYDWYKPYVKDLHNQRYGNSESTHPPIIELTPVIRKRLMKQVKYVKSLEESNDKVSMECMK